MVRASETNSVVRTLAVSGPGGTARHYRIQTMAQPHQWHMHASFGSHRQAVDCLEHLREDGVEARLVSYAISPAAG